GEELLYQPAHCLDHVDAICSLNSRPLQPVIEDGIFVRQQIQTSCVLHYSHTDVVHVLAGQQSIGIIDQPPDQPSAHSQSEFASDQPPESVPDRLVCCDNSNNCVDDELGNPEQCWRQQRGNNSGSQSQHHHRASRLPYEVKDGRHVAKG